MPVMTRFEKEGHLEFKTDNQDLFTFSLEEVPEAGWKLDASTRDLHHDAVLNEGNVMTEYEEKFFFQRKSNLQTDRIEIEKTPDTNGFTPLIPGILFILQLQCNVFPEQLSSVHSERPNGMDTVFVFRMDIFLFHVLTNIKLRLMLPA